MQCRFGAMSFVGASRAAKVVANTDRTIFDTYREKAAVPKGCIVEVDLVLFSFIHSEKV